MDRTPEIDLSTFPHPYFNSHVVGGLGTGETVDEAILSTLIYENKGGRHIGTLRITRPVLEELILQWQTLLGMQISYIEASEIEKRKDT